MCGDGSTSGCEQVAQSPWSSVAGMPLAGLGLVFSLVLASAFVIALNAGSEAQGAVTSLALVLLGAALGVDLVLAGIQAFAIKAFCALCVATYVINALAFALLFPARNALRGALRVIGLPENRAAGAGLALSGLGFVLAVAGLDVALTTREAMRTLTLLGSPTGPAPSALASAGGGPSAPLNDPDHWRAEAKRLQATIDDPQKLEQYFSDKAVKDYADAKVEALDLKDAAFKGSAGAPVQLVEYSDFLCPFCKNLAQGLSQLMPQLGARIQVFYKNYPLDQSCNPNLQRTVHPGACNLALGSICALDQGKFWPYHDRAFSGAHENPQPADVLRLAGEAGLDGSAFGTCMASGRAKDRLAAQIEEARRLGVQSTPTLYVNGKKLPRLNEFLQIVDKEAQAKGFPPLPTGPPGH